MNVTLLHGDCLDLLPTLSSGSVDLVLSDWPYGTTACAWDSVIPLDRLWPEIKRVLKPRGAVVLTASQPFTTALISSNMAWFKYCWVWEKNIPTDFLNAKNKPLKTHEDICIFSPGTTANRSQRKMTYNPQWRQGKGYRVSSPHDRRIGVIDKGTRKPFAPCVIESDGTYYPVSVLRFKREQDRLHPTQKPLALFEYLMRTYSNPGDVVLDNAFGSCTTGEAAIRLGRAFVGMERDPGYYAIGAARCAAAQAAYQPALLEVAP